MRVGIRHTAWHQATVWSPIKIEPEEKKMHYFLVIDISRAYVHVCDLSKRRVFIRFVDGVSSDHSRISHLKIFHISIFMCTFCFHV